jgi:hypothetical protein
MDEKERKEAEAYLAETAFKAADSTIYLSRKDVEKYKLIEFFRDQVKAETPDAAKGPIDPCESFAFALRLQSADSKECQRRYLACPCLEGKFWSLSIRSTGKGPAKLAYENRRRPDQAFSPRKEAEFGYFPKRSHGVKVNGNDGSAFLFSIYELSLMLFDSILEQRSHPGGMVVITGETNCAKSQIARGLIYHEMRKLCREDRDQPDARKPHLVTVEDPIEDSFYDSFFSLRGGRPLVANHSPFDYTPRQIGFDVNGLEQAFRDALRQTPSVLFVGETRDKEDWKLLLDFAGTGHLVVTTAHAGSLREAVDKILTAADAKTPGSRAEVANRLLGVVHLYCPDPVPEKGKDGKAWRFTVIYPSMYRSTPLGKQTLGCDGVSSILPNFRANGPDELKAIGSLGRQACVSLLCHQVAAEELSAYATREFRNNFSGRRAFHKLRKDPSELLEFARSMDLEGR